MRFVTNFAGSIIAALVPLAALADPYVFTTLNVPGAATTSASGVNASGQIVGTYTDSTGNDHGFEYANGSFTAINAPGSGATQAYGINNAGQIVGNDVSLGTGFIDTNGSFTTISGPKPFSIETYSYGINNSAQVVGNIEHDPAGLSTYLYSGGTLSFMSFGASGTVFPQGINDSGEVVGYSYTNPINQPTTAFVYSNGTSISFTVGSSFTQAFGVNDAGQIVGDYRSGPNGATGFLDVNGAFTPIDVPGATSTTAYGINDAGDIVGSFVDSSGTHGFLATPVAAAVPEPFSFALLAIGFASVAVVRRRSARLR